MELNAKELLNTDPRDIDLSDVEDYSGLYEQKCKICVSDWRKLINTLLSLHVSHKQIAIYCNSHKLFGEGSTKLNETNLHGHARNHLKITSALVKQSNRAISKSAEKLALQEVRADLMNKPDEVISAEILRMSVEDFYTGKKTPQLREAVLLVKAVSDKQGEENKQTALVEFFKALKSNPIIAKKAKQRRKLTIEPVPGIKIEQSIEAEV